MVTRKIGELDDWGDGDLGTKDFMNLEEGSNKVRVFTKPYQFYVVWTKDETGKQRKFRSAVENCPLIQRGEKPSPKWYVGVINRKTNAPAIVEIGPQIFKQILSLRKNKSWGDPRGYDIDIERQPKGSQPLYVVLPEPKTKLTDTEKEAIRNFLARVDLTKMTMPPTPEEVREQLGMASAPQVDNEFEDFESVESPTAAEDDDDDDFDFASA